MQVGEGCAEFAGRRVAVVGDEVPPGDGVVVDDDWLWQCPRREPRGSRSG